MPLLQGSGALGQRRREDASSRDPHWDSLAQLVGTLTWA